MIERDSAANVNASKITEKLQAKPKEKRMVMVQPPFNPSAFLYGGGRIGNVLDYGSLSGRRRGEEISRECTLLDTNLVKDISPPGTK